MNEVVWNKQTLYRIKSFPVEIRKELGYLIFRLQVGDFLDMPYSRPMSTIATGCYELRVKNSDGVYRAFYFLKLNKRILIFHAFVKKEQKTPKKEIDLGKINLKEMLSEKK